MAVPVSQMWTVATYVLKQKLKGRKQYPLVLMLEPLFRCNLACAGCGKIQYPAQILRKDLTVEQCLRAVEECGAPIVSIPGGEPLMYSEIGRLVQELVARKKYVYLCTNALLLREKLDADVFAPSKYLSFSIHMDGLREEHEAPLEVQPVAAVPPVPHGQARLRVHAVGEPDLQRVRLAAALLPPPGGLCGDVPGADRDHEVGALRPQERQRQVPGLYGPLRLRAHGRESYVQLLARLPRHRCSDADRTVLSAE